MRLIIRRRPDAPKEALTAHNYDYYIEHEDADGTLYRVDIANRLRKLSLALGVNEVNEVVLTMMLDDIDIDVDAMLELKAVLEERKAEEFKRATEGPVELHRLPEAEQP